MPAIARDTLIATLAVKIKDKSLVWSTSNQEPELAAFVNGLPQLAYAYKLVVNCKYSCRLEELRLWLSSVSET